MAFGAGGGLGGQEVAAGHGQAVASGDADPAVQDLVAGPLDLAQDGLVQLEGDPDTGPGGGGEQGDAGLGGPIVGPGRAGGQVLGVDPEAVQVLGGQIDPAAGVVLAQVADEVGQLEGQAELAGVLPGPGGSAASRMGVIMVPMAAAEPSM